MKWLCDLSYVVLSFCGAFNMKRVLAFLFGVFATLWMAAPAAAWNNDSSAPGSVLVFPKFRQGTVTTTDQGVQPRTEFEISVVCPTDPSYTCAPDQPVSLKGHYVCQYNCMSQVDFTVGTTINGTLYLTFESPTSVYLPGATFIPAPDCSGGQGYLIVYVIDAYGNPIKFDGLIGGATLRGGPQSFQNCPTCKAKYQAIAIQAGDNIPTGLSTDDPANGGNGNGAMDFDGNEYRQVTGTTLGIVQYEGLTFANAATQLAGTPHSGFIQNELTLLTLDVKGLNQSNPDLFVPINFYNEGQLGQSTVRDIVCYETRRIIFDTPGPDNTFGRKGLVVAGPARFDDVNTGTPASLLGLIEVQEGSYVEVTGAETTLRWVADAMHANGTTVATTFVQGP